MTTATKSTTTLSLTDIRTDGGTQPRAAIHQETVDEYAAAMDAGDRFPPVAVFYDGDHYWLADGFHRLRAAQQAEREHIDATVHQGTRRDAVLYSAAANAQHGLRRTNDDKRRAVMTLLKDDEWAQWSDREIARKCRVSNRYVGNLRKEVTVNGSQLERKYVDKHGKERTMNVAGIRAAAQERTADPAVQSILTDEQLAAAMVDILRTHHSERMELEDLTRALKHQLGFDGPVNVAQVARVRQQLIDDGTLRMYGSSAVGLSTEPPAAPDADTLAAVRAALAQHRQQYSRSDIVSLSFLVRETGLPHDVLRETGELGSVGDSTWKRGTAPPSLDHIDPATAEVTPLPNTHLADEPPNRDAAVKAVYDALSKHYTDYPDSNIMSRGKLAQYTGLDDADLNPAIEAAITDGFLGNVTSKPVSNAAIFKRLGNPGDVLNWQRDQNQPATDPPGEAAADPDDIGPYGTRWLGPDRPDVSAELQAIADAEHERDMAYMLAWLYHRSESDWREAWRGEASPVMPFRKDLVKLACKLDLLSKVEKWSSGSKWHIGWRLSNRGRAVIEALAPQYDDELAAFIDEMQRKQALDDALSRVYRALGELDVAAKFLKGSENSMPALDKLQDDQINDTLARVRQTRARLRERMHTDQPGQMLSWLETVLTKSETEE